MVVLKPFAMGLETEYAVSSRSPTERRQPEELARWLAECVRHQRPYLQDLECSTGVYLGNGSRVYTDIHGHPEYATPECSTPAQVAAYDKAGERILHFVARRAASERRLELSVTKNNLGAVAPDRITWGNHESYTSWIPLTHAVDYLVPHLVTRLPYAGSGCLSAHADGFGFELSQRARHLNRVVGAETTHDRAIFCTRVRKSLDASDAGWTRAHLIGKDSQRAPFGTYLTMGTTGLLFWMLNHGFVRQPCLMLADPVRALRTVSLDPWLRRPLPMIGARPLTGLEIQEAYLADCEGFAKQGPLPKWGAEVLRQWRTVLVHLAQDPRRLAGKLDAYTKMFLIEHELRRARFDWSDLREALVLIEHLRNYPTEVLHALAANQPEVLQALDSQARAQVQSLLKANGRRALERLQFALRLMVLDLKYHELGGLYDDLCQAGHIDNVVVTEQAIDQAITAPPPGGRAARRADLIKVHHGQPNWAANWKTVMRITGDGAYDLSNPF
jgi:hypothetical protein